VQVRVRFVTDYEQFRIVDSPFAVPNKLGRHGLSEVINHLLELKESQPFDFLIQGKLVRVPLHKFILNNRMSTEDIITIEYFPAASLSDESENIEAPSWVGSIDNSATVVASGCYNGQVKFFDTENLNEIGNIQAHEDPIRAVLAWSRASGNTSVQTIATASKDQTVKVWGATGGAANYTLQATLPGHMTSVESLALWEAEQNTLLSGDWAGNVFAWDLSVLDANNTSSAANGGAKKKRKNSEGDAMVSSATELKPKFTIKAHGQSISGISGASRNGTVVTCSWDHSMKAWDLSRQDCVATVVCSKVFTSLDVNNSNNAQADPTTSAVLTSHPDGKVRLWDLRVGQEASGARATFGKSAQWISQVRWMPESAHMFAATDYSGSMVLWDTRSPAVPLGRTEAHQGKALCLHWLPSTDQSYRLLTGGSDCSIKATSVDSAEK